MEGKVKWFNRNKGYGFIEGDDGQEYFVHYSALAQGTFIRENDRVSFEAAETDRGKQAQSVTLLQKGSEIASEDGGSSEEGGSSEDVGEEKPKRKGKAKEEVEEEQEDF